MRFRFVSAAANKYSAAGSALGYLAQIEYALLLMLRRLDDEPDLRVSIETLDDIVFETGSGATARELWQTKHHVTDGGSLGDSSTDIWKTIHNWITESTDSLVRVLVSTTSAPPGSAAEKLCERPDLREPASAERILLDVARASGNKAHLGYYEAFLSYDPSSRLELLSTVLVIDGATPVTDLDQKFESAVRKAVPASRRSSLTERLRGWWHSRTIRHLTEVANKRADFISMGEIEATLHYISQSLRDDNLPLDFEEVAEPTADEVAMDERIFVEQLRLISWHNQRIRQAIYDHNRAFLQRSRWEREDLLDSTELMRYDRRLIAEWRRHFLPKAEPDPLSAVSDEEACARARDCLWSLENSSLPEIRGSLQSGYIPNGTLHILSDEMRIGWHRDWVDLLRHRLNEARESAELGNVS